MSESVELKACPFCGGEPSLAAGVGEFWGRCMECEATSVMASRRDRAIEAWNRRVSAAPSEGGERGSSGAESAARLADASMRSGAQHSAGQWQPIETAPRDGTPILILVGGTIHQGSYDGPSDGAIYSGRPSVYNWFSESAGETHHDEEVTHWMPRPADPTPGRAADAASPVRGRG